ncbi:MAG: hypothetical protein M1839_008173 [Geoglossum umbratile]|nr:MAG: hypothetical protein M1839_008173 [Geoglossum umbratile]
MVTLEIFTIILWFCALVALALFAAEVEPICLAIDEVPIIKKIIENCVMTKTDTAIAALSWLLWIITCITLCVQGCRSRRSKKTAIATSGQAANPEDQWGSMEQGITKAEQGTAVTTVEMQSYRYLPTA